MRSLHRKLVVLSVLAGGTMLASGCAITQSILQTIAAAFGIANNWT